MIDDCDGFVVSVRHSICTGVGSSVYNRGIVFIFLVGRDGIAIAIALAFILPVIRPERCFFVD